ncbi:hypothetical protein, partial [Pseudomonas syringae group genomosp. 7]|uniref:hypothetical protein n=1 Tax=Pseudomonas syringae group genomosp. 7 TaxID=251699 RepID=UPI0037700BBB
FRNYIDKIKFENICGNLTIFVACYLLASPSIDSALLAKKINRVHGNASLGPSAVHYTNTERPEARQKFPIFKKNLKAA